MRLWCRAPTVSLDPAAVAVSEGSAVRFLHPGCADRRGPAGVDKPPEWAPLLIEWGRHTGRLSVWALQVTGACYLPRGPWAVSYRSRWCPVVLSGVGGPRRSGVRIVQIFCRIRASQMRRAALWCHRQCSWFTSSGVQAPMSAMRRLATHRHWLGCAMVGGRECCPSR